MKTINAHGRQFRLGRNRPARRKLATTMKQLRVDDVLPPIVVPDSTDYRTAALPSLRNVYGNDRLGDCVIAGGAHVRGVTSFNAGGGSLFTDDQIILQYAAIGGYDPNDPDSDQGCDENTALNFWRTTGWPDGVKLIRAVSVDPTSISEINEALYLFENLFFGVSLPEEWIDPIPSGDGFDWTLAGPAIPENGHCFIGCDIAPGGAGIIIDTWGMLGTISYAAIAQYASAGSSGQLFTLLTPDIVDRVTAKSPAGYDVETLTEYLNAL